MTEYFRFFLTAIEWGYAGTSNSLRGHRILLVGLLVSSGGGQLKEEQTIDAYNRGVDYVKRGDFDKAVAAFGLIVGNEIPKPDDSEHNAE
jgi:hypothetical protein